MILSRMNFGYKVLFIIDPRRVLLSNTNTTTNADNNDSSTSRIMYDPSIFGCDLYLGNKINVNVCHLLNIKDSIISLGGISTLLKIIHMILGGDKIIPFFINTSSSRKKNDITSTTNSRNGHKSPCKKSNSNADRPSNVMAASSTRIIDDLMTQESGIISLIPSILFLFAGFLRNHANNARDMIKCDGVEILEQILLHNKRLGLCLLTTNSNINSVKTNSDSMMLIGSRREYDK